MEGSCLPSLTLQKFYSGDADDINTWELTISNRSTNILNDIMITDIQKAQGKCHTQSLLFPSYIRCSSPHVMIHMCVYLALEEDDYILQDYNTAVQKKVHEFMELQFSLIEQERDCLYRKGKTHHNFLPNLTMQCRQLANLLTVFSSSLINNVIDTCITYI